MATRRDFSPSHEMAPIYPKTIEVSDTRLYVGNLPEGATKEDVASHFANHGTGKIVDIKLMSGYGFIEYEDPLDARDVVPAFHRRNFKGNLLVVQFASRKIRDREDRPERRVQHNAGPRRSPYRMTIYGLRVQASWQDLKDFARSSGCNVVYSEAGYHGKGTFVEFETLSDLRRAIETLDGVEFKGDRVQCVAEDAGARGRSRSRSPDRSYPDAAYSSTAYDYHHAPAPRGYSPPRHYREREIGQVHHYEHYYPRSPPRQYRTPPPPYGMPPPARYHEPAGYHYGHHDHDDRRDSYHRVEYHPRGAYDPRPRGRY